MSSIASIARAAAIGAAVVAFAGPFDIVLFTTAKVPEAKAGDSVPVLNARPFSAALLLGTSPKAITNPC